MQLTIIFNPSNHLSSHHVQSWDLWISKLTFRPLSAEIPINEVSKHKCFKCRWRCSNCYFCWLNVSSPPQYTDYSVSLTGVTVLARPTRQALAEIPSNQISAGVGVDARVVVAFVGIWKETNNRRNRLDRKSTLQTAVVFRALSAGPDLLACMSIVD